MFFFILRFKAIESELELFLEQTMCSFSRSILPRGVGVRYMLKGTSARQPFGIVLFKLATPSVTCTSGSP